VLIGGNQLGDVENQQAMRNAKIISVADSPDFEKATKKIPQNVSGINILLTAHGDPQGRFLWNEGTLEFDGEDVDRIGVEWLEYKILFQNLPRKGVNTISIGSCYGETAITEANLQVAPEGSVVISIASKDHESLKMFAGQFAKETDKLINPIDIFIEALDNFNSKEYIKEAKRIEIDENAALAMPSTIGIGGKIPTIINLDDKLQYFENKKELNKKNEYWQNAIKRVKLRFDRESAGCELNTKNDNCEAIFSDTKHSQYTTDNELTKKIDEVSAKINNGNYAPKDAEEIRISRALVAAYMDESGEIALLRGKATGTLEKLEKENCAVGIDDNKDGHIELEELRTKLRKYGVKEKSLDLNKDGIVEAYEIVKSLHNSARAGLAESSRIR